MTMDGQKGAVGLVGLGALGIAIAEKLLGSGFRTHGYRRSSMSEFERLGGMPAASLTEMADAAAIILLVLPNDRALVESLDALLPKLTKGHVLVVLSNHPVTVKRQAAETAARAGACLLDGEVSGTPAMLREGKASLFLAGDEDARVRVQPVLAGISSRLEQFPRFGDAAKLKLLANYLVAANVLAAADALAMGEVMGLDARTVVDSLSRSAASSRMLEVRGPMMARGDVGSGDLTGFMKFFDGLEREAGGRSSLLRVVQAHYAAAVKQGHGACDLAAIGSLLRKREGLGQ